MPNRAPSHHAPSVDRATKHAAVLDALRANPDGLTAEEVCTKVRRHLSRVQANTTLTELRKLGTIERSPSGPYNPGRWRIVG